MNFSLNLELYKNGGGEKERDRKRGINVEIERQKRGINIEIERQKERYKYSDREIEREV